MRRWPLTFALLTVAASCDPPPGAAAAACEPCARADVCCAARTANPQGNCHHLDTCLMFTGDQQATVVDGCQYYLRVGSTPPAPAVCGPHPDAE